MLNQQYLQLLPLGSIIASANYGLSSATSITATAAEDLYIAADAWDADTDQVMNLNADSSALTYSPTVTYTINANNLDTLNLGGITPINVSLDAADISSETVTNTNTAGAFLTLNQISSDSDMTKVDPNIIIIIGASGYGNTNTLKVAEGQTYALDVDSYYDGSLTFKHKTDAIASGSNSMTLSVYDNNPHDWDVTANASGLNFTDINHLTITLDDLSFSSYNGNLTGSDLESVTITGGGTPSTGGGMSTFDMSSSSISGNANVTIPPVIFNASDYTGNVKLKLSGLANSVETVTIGSGMDLINVLWTFPIWKCL